MKKPNPYIEDLLTALDAEDTTAVTDELQELRSSDVPQFGTGFADRIVAAVTEGEESWETTLPTVFRWVALLGIAASILLLVMNWYEQDAMTFDAMAGLADLTLSDELALNAY